MISILFATYNGSDSLPQMLDAYCHLQIPNNKWKVIAVDNGSTDNTAEIIKSFQDKLPIEYLYEAKKGKNNALNRGLKSIKGDLVILTDDDIIPDPDWVLEYLHCANQRLEFEIFTGKILPQWPKSPFPEFFESIPKSIAYGLTSDNIVSGEIEAGSVFGGNMMVRTSLFKKGTQFNGSIGPNCLNYAMGSETEFVKRMVKNHHSRCFYTENSRVKHIIHKEQLTKKWLMGRAFRCGRGNSLNENKNFTDEYTILGLPYWLLLLYLKKQFLAVIEQTYNSKNKSIIESWKASFYRGYIYQKFL